MKQLSTTAGSLDMKFYHFCLLPILLISFSLTSVAQPFASPTPSPCSFQAPAKTDLTLTTTTTSGETKIFIAKDSHRITSIRKSFLSTTNQVKYVGTQFNDICRIILFATGMSEDPVKLFAINQTGALRTNPAMYIDGINAENKYAETMLRNVGQVTGGPVGATAAIRKTIIQRLIIAINRAVPKLGYTVSTRVTGGTIYHSAYLDTLQGIDSIVMHSYTADASGRVLKTYGFHSGLRVNSKGSEGNQYAAFMERIVSQQSGFNATQSEIIDLFNQAMSAETGLNDILTLSILALILV